MRKTLYILFLSILTFSLFMPFMVWGQTIPQKGVQSITPEEMKAHVAYLASDEMKGRNTPSLELDTCAAYIAREFESYGLKPVGTNNSYHHTLFAMRTRLGDTNTLEVTFSQGTTPFRLKNDFVPLHVTANRKISELPVVFAGYGITAPEYDYDDYQDIDAKGKVVLIFINEPQEKDSTSIFEGRRQTEHSKILIKVENAMDHGASGVLLASNPNSRSRRPPNHWPSLMRNPPKNAVPLVREESTDKKIVCVRIGKKLAEAFIEGSEKNLLDLHSKIDEMLKPQSFNISGLTVSIETNLIADKTPTHNVVGYWEGHDPELKNELVIIGAHYDHVGVRGEDVYNGADDNASGTAGVMEIAEAFSHCSDKPKRSVLFIAFTGEEKGFFGSYHYTDHPIFPLENTIAMLNMDMISRNDTNEVAIIGAPTSSDLKAINEEANKNIGMTLAYDQEQYFMRSDHYPFYRKNIPVLFYNTRDTPDLHKPTDDPEKTIPEKMANISRLVFSTAWIVVNRTERPNFTKVR